MTPLQRKAASLLRHQAKELRRAADALEIVASGFSSKLPKKEPQRSKAKAAREEMASVYCNRFDQTRRKGTK